MSTIPLKDIYIKARQESFRMRHYYIGVEHLFIALLEIQGGLAATILEDHGLTTDYVIDAIRRRMGKGSNRNRLWSGMPNTPRAEIVVNMAQDIALEMGKTEIQERELLTAILEEADSLPIRVLRQLGLDLDQLISASQTRAAQSNHAQAYLQIEFGNNYQHDLTITDEQLFILRRMFHGYSQIRIERYLTGGYTKALVLVVTPLHADDQQDAPVVVKIDRTENILDEAQRYETHVKNTLPPLTARLEDKPVVPELSDLAGIKYTFVTTGTTPQDLRSVAQQWGMEALGNWLQQNLYPYFGKTWWQQRRTFRFQTWMEYDWLLPPLLTLDYIEATEPANAVTVRDPVRPSRLKALDYGDIVTVEGFTVQQVYPDRNAIRLTIGRGSESARRAFKIEITGIDLRQNTFYRGEIVERISGQLTKTRTEQLYSLVQSLEPYFDINSETIPGIVNDEWMPNPLTTYESVLDLTLNGSVSKIHGDLHLGNILVGPGNNPFLIDFEHTREGHTLSDWASLEVSLLGEVVAPIVGDTWEAAQSVIQHLIYLGEDLAINPALTDAIKPIIKVRSIVRDCLQSPDMWTEYYTALGMYALRALNFQYSTTDGRRIMFLVAAYAFNEIRRRPRIDTSETSPDIDLTDSSTAPPQ